MFLSVCLNPTMQKTIVLDSLRENEVNRSREHRLDASGKGINVTRVLHQLGEKAVHLTHAGGRNRDRFLEEARGDGLLVEWVESGSEMRYCYTVVNREGKTTTELIERTEPVGKGTADRLLASWQKLLPKAHTVIISGTRAPGFPDGLYPGMVKQARAAGKTVILDYRGPDLVDSMRYGPDVIKPNFSEFAWTFLGVDKPGENEVDRDLEAKVRGKMKELHAGPGVVTVLTRGRNSCLFIEKGEIREFLPERIDPVNTIGCGDAFTAGFAAEYHRSRDVTRAVELGLDCAGKNALLIRPGVIR